MIGTPSRLRLILKAAVLARISPDFDFNMEDNDARRKWKYDDPKFFKFFKLKFDCAD